MKRQTAFWAFLMLAGVAALIGRATFTSHGMARQYVHAVPVADGQWIRYDPATYNDYVRARNANPNQTEYQLSRARTVGVWIAAFFTLAIFSFLYGDNPFYRVTEAIYIGSSAAYWMVIYFWDSIIPNLMAKIWPKLIQAWAMPGLSGPAATRNLSYMIPLILGIMLIWRLSPVGSWISRWPLSFIIGTTAGLQLIAYLHGDFLAQIRNSILPLYVTSRSGFDFWSSANNLVIVIGVLACLTYFFFSVEHTGFVGKTAKLGTWFLMITFGAGFGYTVMGRIALLAARVEFLLDDWLWLIDPLRRHGG